MFVNVYMLRNMYTIVKVYVKKKNIINMYIILYDYIIISKKTKIQIS